MLNFYRLARWLYLRRPPILPRLLYIFNRIFFAVVLLPSAEVGRNVIFGSSGLAILVRKRARISNNVIVGTNATIGGRSGFQDVPIIGNDVVIGAGARILGPVKIGDGARIGANAVVIKDVPAGAVAVGVPAQIKSAAGKHRP